MLMQMMAPNHTSTAHGPGAVLLGLALLALVALLAIPSAEPADAALGDPLDPPQPNIVLIVMDDQPAATVTPEAMPNVYQRLIAPGSSFSDYIVTTPLCCPSRASMLTGQYGHNNGVLTNAYSNLIEKRSVLPQWLQRAGYTTAHIGKFLNGYGAAVDAPEDVAPGWDEWFTQFERKRYYNWKASKNGQIVRYGDRDEDHLTEVLNRRAASWAKRLASKPEPFYMQLDHYAPHGANGRDDSCRRGPVPASRDEGHFALTALPSPASFNEADVSDKPLALSSRPLLSEADIAELTLRYRCTLEAVRSADRGIGKLFRKIEQQGELDRTVFIFTSDNGYFFGEHRIVRGKDWPYEENVRMPLSILIPEAYRKGAAVPATVTGSAANIDLAPTILELAKAAPCLSADRCRTMDGRSLLPLLDGRGGWPADRSLLIERDDCRYRGVRSQQRSYVEYSSGPLPTTGGCKPNEIEHYDLAQDPLQLDNLYPSSRRSANGELEIELQGQLDSLAHCSGVAGRDPLPASGVYCP